MRKRARRVGRAGRRRGFSSAAISSTALRTTIVVVLRMPRTAGVSGAHSAALRMANCDSVTLAPVLVHPGQGVVALGGAQVDQHAGAA